MLSKRVLKTDDISSVVEGTFVFCYELGKGFIKRNLQNLNLQYYSFENVLNKIESLTKEQLYVNGLDSVLFIDGVITESKVYTEKVKEELNSLPIETHPSSIDTIVNTKKSHSRYFTVDNYIIPTKQVYASTNYIADTKLSILENIPHGTQISPNIILLNINSYKYELLNYIDTFEFRNGILYTVGDIDYETRINYALQMKISDKADSTKFWLDTVDIDVIDLPDTIFFNTNNTFNINENNTIGAVVGDLTSLFTKAVGLDLIMTLNNNTNNFNIVGNNLTAKVVFDYESLTQYIVSVRLTDTHNPQRFWDMDVVVNVVNQPDVLTSKINNMFIINENNVVGAVVGDLTSIFTKEVGMTVSYSLLNNTNNFNIVGSNLTAKVVFDYETTTTYSVTVRITNTNKPTQYVDSIVNVNISNVGDYLVLNPTRVLNINENNSIGTTVGDLSTLFLKEQLLNVSYSLLNNTNNFNIVGSNLTAKVVFDYETTTTYSVTVRITNTATPNQYWDMPITVNIGNLDEFPVGPVVSGIGGNMVVTIGDFGLPNACVANGVLTGIAFDTEHWGGMDFAGAIAGGPTNYYAMYQSGGTGVVPIYVGFIFNTATKISKISFDSHYYPIARWVEDFTLEVSNNTVTGTDGTWTAIANVSGVIGWTDLKARVYSFTNSTSYKAYRLKITKYSTYMDIGNFKFIS